MMMTKPAPSSSSSDAAAASASTSEATAKKKASPQDAVKDLEKRLELLGNAPPPASTEPTLDELKKAAAPAPAPAAAAAAAPKTTGKADLLARIMAAQERAKQPPPAAAAPAATTTTTDLLDGFDAPAESESAPPPPFDVSLLPAQTPAPPPPAFDESTLPPPAEPKQSANSVSFDPNVTVVDAAPPAASAPVFEDLLDDSEDQKMPPPPSYNVTPVAPPTTTTETTSAGGGMDQEAIDAILGIEGLSDAEKAALIAEQEKIMASIEQEKSNKGSPSSASARADAFEQRSHAAAVQAIGGGSSSSKAAPRTVDLGDGNEVALHGQKKTFEAIKDGTAVLVQCLSCENWMQVTGKATMMFCPVCQTVSPVASADDKAAASQMAADMELAEQLQKEEYRKEEKRQAALKAKKKAEQSSPTSSGQQQQDGSWMEWLGFGAPAPAPPQAPPSFAQKPVERGEIGVSLPPGASRNNAALAMAPAYTGQEDDGAASSSSPRIQLSSSRDESVDSDVGPAGARVAKQQPIFSCVADSISSAATQMYNTISQDEQGNVHGVDTQGLLAVSQAGRDTNTANGSAGGTYENMK